MDELSSIVEAMLPEIENNFVSAPSIFKLWFEGFKLISLSETSAVFTTPTALRKKILSTKYIDVISQNGYQSAYPPAFAVDGDKQRASVGGSAFR